MSYRVAESELLTDYRVLKRVKLQLSYEFGRAPDISNEAKGNPRKRGAFSEVSETRVTSEPRNSWRYSVGLTPQISRKTCAKCCCVLKPQATATSNTRTSGARNIALARSILWRRTN